MGTFVLDVERHELLVGSRELSVIKMSQCGKENVAEMDKGEDGVRLGAACGRKKGIGRKFIARGGRKNRQVGRSVIRVTVSALVRFPKEATEGSDYSPQMYENEKSAEFMDILSTKDQDDI